MTEEAKKDKKINMVFSKILIMERKKRSWSQKKLAEKLDVNASTVKRWEGGLILPKNYAREKLQEVLKLSLMDLGLDKDFDDQLPPTRNNGKAAPEEGIPSEGEVGSQPAATDHLDSVEKLDEQPPQKTVSLSDTRTLIFAWIRQKSITRYMAMALIVSILIIFLPLEIFLGFTIHHHCDLILLPHLLTITKKKIVLSLLGVSRASMINTTSANTKRYLENHQNQRKFQISVADL